MKPKVKPIRDLYFRFIEGTEYDGKVNAQMLADWLAWERMIVLVPHKTLPRFEHYRDAERLDKGDVLGLMLINTRGGQVL
jgi:hypothetical protein